MAKKDVTDVPVPYIGNLTLPAKLQLDLDDEIERSTRLTKELKESRSSQQKAENSASIAVGQLEQCLADWKYAAKTFGNHDWMVRRHAEICIALKALGKDVNDKL